MTATTQLTRRSAVLLGLLCVVCGVPPVLISLGVIPGHLDPGVPAWMGVAAGSAFLFAAVLLFADAVAGETNPDGSLPATAPAFVRFVQNAAGLGIVGLMGAMATWIAFGKGERHFSATVSLPFIAYHPQHPDLPGRIAFGIGAVLIWIVVIAGTVAALKKHLARLRSA
jgi:hypothetical protein